MGRLDPFLRVTLVSLLGLSAGCFLVAGNVLRMAIPSFELEHTNIAGSQFQGLKNKWRPEGLQGERSQSWPWGEASYRLMNRSSGSVYRLLICRKDQILRHPLPDLPFLMAEAKHKTLSQYRDLTLHLADVPHFSDFR